MVVWTGLAVLPFPLLLRQLSLCILHLFLLPVSVFDIWDWLSSTEPLTSNRAIFVCEHKVVLKLWQYLIRSHMIRTLKCLPCASSTKWYFHLSRKCQACERESPYPLTVFCLCNVRVIQLIHSVSSSFSKVIEFHDLRILLTISSCFSI